MRLSLIRRSALPQIGDRPLPGAGDVEPLLLELDAETKHSMARLMAGDVIVRAGRFLVAAEFRQLERNFTHGRYFALRNQRLVLQATLDRHRRSPLIRALVITRSIYGIFVAITVMNWTFASSDRLAI